MIKKLLKMSGKIFLTAAASILIIFTACSENGIGPKTIEPGRRDYTWTVDTIDAPYDTYYRMWASSSTDIWAVSSGDWDKSIAHFDGNKWNTFGIQGLLGPHSVYGFSRNDVYIGTANGQIWRFDGNNWNKTISLTKDGSSNIVFTNIWGESQNNFYAFGGYPDNDGSFNNSVIANCLNNNWIMINTNNLCGIVAQLNKNKADSKIYMQLYRMGNGQYPDSSLVYEYAKGQYNKLYGGLWTWGLQSDISLINNKVYFVLGSRIAIRVNNQFQTILNVNDRNFYQRIWGRNSKDIFLLMVDGLAHYNGTDIKYLFYFNKNPRTQIYGAALFKDEVFFQTYESQTHLNLVYHGILK